MICMNKVDPEKIFDMYMSIKRHFSEKKFDAIKCNGKLGLGYLYHKRSDRGLIRMFGNVCNDTKHVASIMVSNFAYGNSYPFGDIEVSLANYNKWQKNRQSMMKIFRDDISFIRSVCRKKNIDFQDLLCYTKGSTPILFQMFLSGKINIETISIIDRIEGLIDMWDGCSKLWKHEFLRITKVSSFINIDTKLYAELLDNTKSLILDDIK